MYRCALIKRQSQFPDIYKQIALQEKLKQKRNPHVDKYPSAVYSVGDQTHHTVELKGGSHPDRAVF